MVHLEMAGIWQGALLHLLQSPLVAWKTEERVYLLDS